MLDSDDFEHLLGGVDSSPSGPPSGIPAALPHEMDESALAALCRLSLSMVRTQAREGVFVRSRRGRYDVALSVGNYIERLRKVASGRSLTSNDLAAEKLRLTKAQADKEETRVARERGELVSAADVTQQWAGILRDLRNALLAVPSRCGATLPHLTATDIATLEREIHLALEGVAHGN